MLRTRRACDAGAKVLNCADFWPVPRGVHSDVHDSDSAATESATLSGAVPSVRAIAQLRRVLCQSYSHAGVAVVSVPLNGNIEQRLWRS